MSFEETLRETLRAVLREELDRALADRSTPENTLALAGKLTIAGAAARSGYSASTINKWLNEKKLTRHGKGRLTRVDALELDRLTRDMGSEPSATPSQAEIDEHIAAALKRVGS